MTTEELLSSAWDPSRVVVGACAVAIAGYAVRFRGRLAMRSLWFVAAIALFFMALASPIGVLARGYLFSAHMLQHLLLLLVVPLLLLAGLPREPDEERPGESHPAAIGGAWFAGVGAMWIWHVPTLCNAAATIPAVQTLQTLSLVVMGLAFFRPVFAPRLSDRMPAFGAMLYLFAACIACTILGVLVTLSPVAVCSAYMHPVDALGVMPLLREGWGLSFPVDQELGGLLMWVPPCFIYAGAILGTLGRYYRAEHPAPRTMAGVQ